MNLITVAGPPSSGKTSVILHLLRGLEAAGKRTGVVKFDCISPDDAAIYRQEGIPVATGLAGNLCPDHFFAASIRDCVAWGERSSFDLLITESAGLCCRCSPHINGILAICVIDVLAGISTPKKIGPMLRLADIVVITRGDLVSPAEREVFAFRVAAASPKARIVPVNGLTGQGIAVLLRLLGALPESGPVDGARLRFALPAALCPYCLGETRLGDIPAGNVRPIEFPPAKRRTRKRAGGSG